jgi:hypothetical protein
MFADFQLPTRSLFINARLENIEEIYPDKIQDKKNPGG